MTRSVPAVAALALGAALVFTGCQATSHSCRGGECHVTVNGTGKMLDIMDRDVKVTEISDTWMAVSVDRSRPTRIPVGESARVGPVTIRVTSIKDQVVKFDME
ncbi:hypothetical protein ACN3XK_03455 [Actinomadura welshii]